MTTLVPRPPYTEAELKQLYPASLELQQVQILLRHGERTPISSRFKNTGLPTYWPYCEAANRFKDVVLTGDGKWNTLQWTRRMETLGVNDVPIPAAGNKGQKDSICEPGELTDRGRETTLALGQRIRRLYIDQLHFLPPTLSAQTQDNVYLRSTPIQRALESTHQTYTGLYSPSTRAPNLPPKPIHKRAMWEETLFPNEGACKRFAQLAHAFASRTAALYNEGPEMAYLNERIGKWMPDDSPTVKVDSHPRLSGIMDTVNATRAHGAGTTLPAEFYDEKVIGHVNRICTEEWFGGYMESNEYRKLGIGGLVGDLTQGMVERSQARQADGGGSGEGGEEFKLSLAGCHDTTIAAALTALGAFDVRRDHWPNYTSNVAFELFRRKDTASDNATVPNTAGVIWASKEKTWWSSLFTSSPTPTPTLASAPRTPLAELPLIEREKLKGFYVRLRYNDTPVSLPYCKQAGRHLEGDESFCTLEAFKEAADSFTPVSWRRECRMNLGTPAMGGVVEPPPGVDVTG